MAEIKGNVSEDVTQESRRLVKALLERTLEWERTWRDKAPNAVKCLAKDIDT